MTENRFKRIGKYFLYVAVFVGYLVLIANLFGTRNITLYIYLAGGAVAVMMRVWVTLERGTEEPGHLTDSGREVLVYATGFSGFLFLVAAFLTFMANNLGAAGISALSLVVALFNYPEDAERQK